MDSKDIRKHINDIFRLHEILDDTQPITLPEDVIEDMSMFIDRLAKSDLNPTAIPDVESSLEEIISTYKSILSV